MNMYTVNNQLSALGTYLKTKSALKTKPGGLFVWTGWLVNE